MVFEGEQFAEYKQSQLAQHPRLRTIGRKSNPNDKVGVGILKAGDHAACGGIVEPGENKEC
jgi:hypothetical protein